MGKKGFIFSLEAAISLLLAISLIAGIHYLRLPNYSGVYLKEIANDLQEVAAKKYYSEFAAFSREDFLAGENIGDEFTALIDRLGDYCLIIEARLNSLRINCEKKNENNFQKIIPTSRIFFDGEDFFELKMRLIA
ncbi:MAG: hypothetical protein ABH863_02295 [Candidatus Micrarchaeota archaeon]